jgi:hypothetical protein
MRRALVLSLLALTVAAAAACSTAGSTAVSIDVTAGQETSAWDGITKVTVDVTSQDGSVKLTSSTTPDGGVDFGNISNDEQITVNVLGYAGGTQVMTGSSLSGLLLDSLLGGTLPVFAARMNQWARPPGGLAASHLGGVATVVQERYVLLTGGTRAAGDAKSNPDAVDSYDVFGLTGDATSTAFDPVPETVISIDATDTQPDPLIVLITAGGATLLDYATGQTTALDAPSTWAKTATQPGLSFADVAGGRVIQACVPTSAGGCSAGVITYVVGATRRGSASTAVLEVDSSGDLAGFRLNAPRQGAAATWIASAGLVVAGGSATAPGVEVLSDTATVFTALSFPPIATEGAAAILHLDTDLVLVGGQSGGAPAPTVTLDPACSGAACTLTPVAMAKLPVALENTVGYLRTDGTTYLVVGDDLSGTGFTLGFLVDVTGAGKVTPVPFREPRKGATTIDVPNGTVAVLGGEHGDGTPALSVEMFYP